jgi:peptidoglycan hydrolase-like amidase
VASADTTVTISGHGYGHGRGLGQYGALGYSIDYGWSWDQIVDHFYGGTTAGNVGNPLVGVRLESWEGKTSVAVTQADAQLITDADGGVGRYAALLVTRNGASFDVATGPGCAGPWTPLLNVPRATLAFWRPDTLGTGIEHEVQACDAGLTSTHVFRGALETVNDGSLHLVNLVGMDDYLRGSVPQESPASWGALGGGKGINALEAQAVAARSYALADKRYSYALTCSDTKCQMYLGRGTRNAAGAYATYESSYSDFAVAATSGVVRLLGGAPARTEYSASTGGYTAGGTFPAVPDLGDATLSNPYHTWATTVPTSTIEGAYGKGALVSVDQVVTTGLGDDGGRVVSMRLVFSGGAITVSGSSFQSTFGLRSSWFRFGAPPPPPAPPAGGYTVTFNGTVVPFGGAPPSTGSPLLFGNAKALVIGGPSGVAGFVYDSQGKLWPVNGATAIPGGDLRWQDDSGRDAVLRPDGVSGYVLDRLGGVYGVGGLPNPFPNTWRGDKGPDWARRIALRPDGLSGYVVGADGGVSPFGAAPPVVVTPLPFGRSAVDLLLAPDDTGYVVADDGSLYPFGVSGRAPASRPSWTGPQAAIATRADGLSGYTTTSDGTLSAFGNAIPTTGAANSGPRRDIALAAGVSGYVLDGFGGLHPFGGAAPAVATYYVPGRDIARRVVARPNGGGYVLDAYGGLHAFATVGRPAPPTIFDSPSWPGWDIARDVALLPRAAGGQWDRGYVLDGYGGIHPVGGAPAVHATAYWPKWDIARKLVLLPDGTGGFVLDGFGGLHPFAVGAAPMPAVPGGMSYWPGWDIARDVVLTSAAAGYTLDAFGGVHGFGGASGTGTWYQGDADIAHAASAPIPGSGFVAYVDGYGGVHTAPAPGSPTVDVTTTWPGWDIARDVAVIPLGG